MSRSVHDLPTALTSPSALNDDEINRPSLDAGHRHRLGRHVRTIRKPPQADQTPSDVGELDGTDVQQHLQAPQAGDACCNGSWGARRHKPPAASATTTALRQISLQATQCRRTDAAIAAGASDPATTIARDSMGVDEVWQHTFKQGHDRRLTGYCTWRRLSSPFVSGCATSRVCTKTPPCASSIQQTLAAHLSSHSSIPPHTSLCCWGTLLSSSTSILFFSQNSIKLLAPRWVYPPLPQTPQYGHSMTHTRARDAEPRKGDFMKLSGHRSGASTCQLAFQASPSMAGSEYHLPQGWRKDFACFASSAGECMGRPALSAISRHAHAPGDDARGAMIERR